MKKEDTIKMYLDTYMEGKSESERDTFLSRTIEKQYSAIMAWRYRRNKKSADGESTGAAFQILESLRNARKKLSSSAELSDQELRDINTEIQAFHQTMEKFLRLRTERQIADLEKKQMEIEDELRRLKSLKELKQNNE